MTTKYAHARVFYCDAVGCKRKEFSASGELPPGWVEVDTVGEEDLLVVLHRCPSCATKAAR